MLRKVLLSVFCLSLLAAPAAFAADRGNYQPQAGAAGDQLYGTYPNDGVCYKGANGTGEAIGWAKSAMQCQTLSNGQSWVSPDGVQNYDRGK